jgi:Arylsulfotransferase (ASST)
MKRNVYIVLGVAVLAWAVLAIVLGSASLKLGSGSSASSAAAPVCLPTTLDHTATLPGTAVDVSPEPGTDTANPHTQVSFLGVPAAQIHSVSVRGAASGQHSGSLRAYSQADGASFAPAVPFKAGEQVSVHAQIAGRPVTFGFRVDTPYSTAKTPEFPNPEGAPADSQSFYTMPGTRAPVLTVTSPDRDPAAGDILTTNGPGAGQYGPLIYTPQGRLVWFDRLGAGQVAENLNEQTYEGKRVLTWWKGRVLSLGFGQGEDIVMSSNYKQLAEVSGGNGLKADLHEFRIGPDDTAYVTAFNPIRCNLRSVEGSADGTITDTAVQQIDMRTGLVRWEWHSLDHVAAAESEVETPEDETPWDWFHINSIDPQPDGRILISARSTWAAYELEGLSGKILWRLGGTKSSFKMGPGTKTAWQHDGRVLPDGDVTLYDDGSNPPIHSQSRAIRIALDTKTHTARLVSSLTHADPPLLSASQGNMQTLPNGNTLVGYGGLPAISEYAPGGAVLFDAHEPYDMSFYRAFRFPWKAQPSSKPAVLAAANNTGEETIVHASWNGATDVASWRVLASDKSEARAARVTVPVSGFETSTILPKRYGHVQVQALDDGGHVLASSANVSTVSYGVALRSEGGRG